MTDASNEKMIDERPELQAKLSELEILRQSLDASKIKEKELYDQLLRLGAEFENFRKRAELRVGDSRKAGREDVLINVVDLSDILVQADESSRHATNVETLKQGLSLVRQQFEKFLTDQNVVLIKTKGEKLDPHLHEAVAQHPTNEVEEGVIVEEVQRGYKLFDRVLRHARVKVACKLETEATKKEE